MKRQAVIQEIVRVLQLLSMEDLRKIYICATTLRDLQ